MMHTAATLIAFAVTLFYAHRTGTLLAGMTRCEKAARGGLGLYLVAAAVTFEERARAGDPFLWMHWFILSALLITLSAYVGIAVGQCRARRQS